MTTPAYDPTSGGRGILPQPDQRTRSAPLPYEPTGRDAQRQSERVQEGQLVELIAAQRETNELLRWIGAILTAKP